MYIKSIITLIAFILGLASQSAYAMVKSNGTFFPEIRAELQKNGSKEISIFDAASAFMVLELRAPPQNGRATIAANGKAVSYTPNNGFAGRDQLLYAATDGNTEKIGIVYINVLDIEHPLPELTVTAVKNSPQQITIFNAQSPNAILKIMAGPLSGNAAILQGGKTVRYIPNQNFIGHDYFVYEASQGKIGTIKINVEDQKRAQARPLPPVPQPKQPNFVPAAAKQPQPLPQIPGEKVREPISVEKPIESMSNEELKAAIKQVNVRLDELAKSVGAGSKETAALTQQVATYNRILRQRINDEKSRIEEQPQEKKKISAGQEAGAANNQHQQSLAADLMQQIREGKQLKQKNPAAQLSPSQKEKWESMNVDALRDEEDRLNRERIKLGFFAKDAPKEKIDRIKQLDIDLKFIGDHVSALEENE